MAAGRPIIFASNASNNPVKEAVGGVTISPGSIVELKDVIMKFFNLKLSEKIKLGNNNRVYVEQNYAVSLLAKKLENVIKELLNMNNSMLNIISEKVSVKTMFLLIIFAYLFSVAIRLIWVFQFSGVESFYWNNQIMINTNDGYYFATAVKDFVFGTNSDNPQLKTAINSYPGVVYTTYLFFKILPFSLDTIILFMPAVISSLIVIPMILIARLYNHSLMGFFAALLGSIAWSYYNRTMTGYYDSDMFAVVMQYFVLYSLLSIIRYRSLNSILLASIFIIIYPLFYPQGLSLIYAMFAILILYLLYYHKKESMVYMAITLISVSLLLIDWQIKLGLITILYILFKSKRVDDKYLVIFCHILLCYFFVWCKCHGFNSCKNIYLFGDRGTNEVGLKFYQVIQTVREAGDIPFEVMANRISGSSIGVIVSLVGYVLLVIKYRPFILALPLIGIGIFSLWGGLRFTVYAVPIAAMSAVFLFYVLSDFIKNKIGKYAFIAVMTIAMIYPNIMHIIGYKIPTVFTKDEVTVLDRLNNISSSKDYTLTWWDYGYPIWYYTDTNTLIDGGKHHNDNFIISKILSTTSQVQAANLARVAVETYVDSNYSIVANTLFKNGQKDQINPNDYLEQLESDEFKLPQATRDIFIYLPNRMLNIFPTVGVFSNIDLLTGQKIQQPFFYKADRFKDDGDSLNLGNGVGFGEKN
uniref:Oligosaccharide transferase n=1 Tax=uncultured organism TaxID=155900 RepID=K7NAG0_9ZZZZ|nr:oligosaccharide transferase [uncultured organism]